MQPSFGAEAAAASNSVACNSPPQESPMEKSKRLPQPTPAGLKLSGGPNRRRFSTMIRQRCKLRKIRRQLLKRGRRRRRLLAASQEPQASSSSRSPQELALRKKSLEESYRRLTWSQQKQVSRLLRLKPKTLMRVWNSVIDKHPFNIDDVKHMHSKLETLLRVDIISKLPFELARYVMSFLEGEDIARASQTCRSWRTVCEDTTLWREKCMEDGLLESEDGLQTFFKRRLVEKRQQVAWKEAYVEYLKVLKSWRTRQFDSPNFMSTSSSDSLSANAAGIYPAKNDSNFIQIRCHDDSVITCLQFNALTNTIVTGSDDFTLKVWSAETGHCISTLQGHTGGVWSSQLSPSDIVISGSTDRTLKVWKAHTGELLHTLNGHTSTVRCLALDKDKVVSGSRDATLRLWDINEGVCLNVFVGHSAAVRCVGLKDNIVVSGAYDCIVMVWDATTGACLHELQYHSSRIYSIQFDGTTIASGSLDATICIWDVKTGKLRHQLTGHLSLTSRMQIEGDLLVSVNADSYGKIWDLKTGACLKTLGGENKHSSAITSLYFNKRHVITSSDDGTVKLWDMKTAEFIRNIVVLPKSSKSGVVWRIRASHTKLVCAIGYRSADTTEDTHLLVYKFGAD